jgi:hypothetical protein
LPGLSIARNVTRTLGVLAATLQLARPGEMKPLEPDPDNAGEREA